MCVGVHVCERGAVFTSAYKSKTERFVFISVSHEKQSLSTLSSRADSRHFAFTFSLQSGVHEAESWLQH